MQCYSPKDLEDVSGEKYILPFDLDVKDNDIVDKIISLFTEVVFYERRSVSKDNDGNIQIKCLYEGKEEYYSFILHFKVFRLKYNDNERLYYKTFKELENGTWMILCNIETDKGPLLEELIELVSLPSFLTNTKLEDYTYQFDV
jgi:hypothetical protein